MDKVKASDPSESDMEWGRMADAELRAVLHYVDVRIEALRKMRAGIASEIDRRGGSVKEVKS